MQHIFVCSLFHEYQNKETETFTRSRENKFDVERKLAEKRKLEETLGKTQIAGNGSPHL